mmetsp:Transcript_16650/g.26405  ORF Transcript_16650/g.26405 Transcript_16650/m.26405 type:complete len:216 (+) Transcript_16650:774-1421(+)
MRTVEKAKLHELVGLDVSNHKSSGLLPFRASKRKLVLDNPLSVVLSADRPSVFDFVSLGEVLNVGIRRRRRDPVHHGRGEGCIFLDPIGELWVYDLGILSNDTLHQAAVHRQVVTRKDGIRSHAAIHALLKASYDVSNRSYWNVRIGEIVLNHRVFNIQVTGRIVNSVSFLCHGKRRDASIRRCKTVDDSSGSVTTVSSVQIVDNRPDHLNGSCF